MSTLLLPRWALLAWAMAGTAVAAHAQQCANPGRDGRATLTTAASPNTYYPSNGAQTLSVGATSINLGVATGATTAIAAGDLLLIIQMQGADIDNSNTSSYGTVSSTGYTAGTYEYVSAQGAVPVGGGTLTLATGLVNSYANAPATASSGQRSFQVVRVPQYSSLTLASNVSATPWNGSSGGLLVLDVANQTNLAGFTLNATAAGFRGGAGRRLSGDGSRNAYMVNDYRTAGSTTSTGGNAAGTGSTIGGVITTVPSANGTKGEGTAGTPRYVSSSGVLLDTRTSYNGLSASLNDGYPSGDNGRGAPTDAGGGATDGAPSNTTATDGSPQINSRNSGGGGGANGGSGGRGGNSWTNNLAIGGEPGAAFAPASTSRLVPGGGGGAGSSNDGTNDANRTGINSSGGAGGGIVILRTATISSAGGTIVANGASASSAVANDGSGGGGAGGSILVTATTATNISFLTLNANGGAGGSNTQGGVVAAHGPGGGGGGGIILTNSPAGSATAAAGATGVSITTTAPLGTAYGAAPGSVGLVNTGVSPSIANSVAGASCPADVTTTITGPATLNAGQPSGTFTAVFTNNGTSNASLVTQVVTLPSGATLTSDQQTALTMAYGAVVYDQGANTLTFPTAFSLEPGRSNVFTFAFTAPTTATTSATIASNVSTGANQGADVAPNAASQSLTVLGVANVATTLSASSPTAASGSTVTLTAGFNNLLGNTAAAGVVGQVQLPTGLTNVTTSAGTYNGTTGVVTYNIGTLAAGASATSLSISYTQPATGTVAATATISTTTNEAGQVSNNQVAATVAPNVTADVATALNGPATATAGSQVTFGVMTSNAGTGTNTNVVQTVTLPSGATNVYATGGAVVSTTGGVTTVTFPAIAALAAGQRVDNTVSFTAPATGSFATTAGVTSTQDGNTTGNNAASVTTTTSTAAAGSANLYTTITPSATNVAAGAGVTFTVTQGNAGPNAASGVASTVSLPTSLPLTLQVNGAGPTSTTSTTATYANGATYHSTTGQLTYNSIAISQASGAAQSYTITVPALAEGVLTATASVTATTPDVMLSNNVASTQVTVAPNPTDLATALSGPDQASVGQRVTYTATTLNNGPSATNGIVQRVQTLAGLPLTGATALFLNGAAPATVLGTTATYADGSTYNSSTGLVAFATTAAAQVTGGAVSNTLTFSVPNNGNASLVNTARVRSSTSDTNPANNAASVVTTIQPVADVQVTLTGPGSATLASATQGAPITYGVVTTNTGLSVAGSVTTIVRLPSGLSDVVVTSYDGTVLTNSATTGYNSSTGVVTFPAVTAQPSGAAYASAGSITFTSPAGTYALAPTATATLTATTANPATEPNLTNNSATVVTTLVAPTTASVDLSVTIARSTGTAATVAAGSPVVFNVTTTNAGTSTASASTGAVTTVQLPAGLTTTGTVTLSNGGTYDNATGLATFTTTSALAIGGSVANTITISAAPGQGPLVATAAVRGTESDLTPANNAATTSVGISSVVDVATTVAGPTVASAGSPVGYTVTTTNNGPSTATTVAQTVTLPAGIVSYSLNGGTAVVLNGGNATASTTVVTLPVPATLPAGTNNTVVNMVTFSAPASTTSNFPFSVIASTSAGNETGVATNNTASASTARYAQSPVANNVTNTLQAPEANTAAVALAISPLSATATANPIASYSLATLPTTAQGVLSYNNNGTYTNITTAGQGLTTAQAASLRFLPASGYVGNASFTYTATDNAGLLSNVATYLLPIGADNAAVATSTTPKNSYATNDILTYVLDANGAQYTNGGSAAGIVYNVATGALQSGAANGLATSGTNAVLAATGPSGNPTNTLPSGVRLNATTGQLFVFDASLLPAVNTNTLYSINVVVTDLYGGVSTVTESFQLGTNPLPVRLVAFTAEAVRQDARLSWQTASELNNDHFELERSLDGTSFAKIGQVAGQGSTSTASSYQFTDAGVGAYPNGLAYYRLRQVDTDGTATYSPVRTVSFTAPTELALFPNPAASASTLDLRTLPPTSSYSVTLLDATGRAVLGQTLSGGQAHSLDLGQLAKGVYLLQVRGENLRLTKRLTKE